MDIKRIIREEFKDSSEEDWEWTEGTNPSFSDELLYLLEGTQYSFTLSNNGGFLLRLYYNTHESLEELAHQFLRSLMLQDDTIDDLKLSLYDEINFINSDIEFEKRMQMPDLDKLSEKITMLEEILNLLNEH